MQSGLPESKTESGRIRERLADPTLKVQYPNTRNFQIHKAEKMDSKNKTGVSESEHCPPHLVVVFDFLNSVSQCNFYI